MGAPRPEDLRAGDILLLRSPGRLAWAIRQLDGAEVDRAALCLGGGRVTEVAEGRVVIRGADECLASAEHFVARRLKEPAPMEPVVGRAETLREADVSGGEVVLALLACSRKLRAAPSLRGLQRACLERGASAISAAEPLTGAQFVWRCFEDALPEPSDVYTLRLNDLHNLEVVAGVPGEPGAGVARRVGRGVHPHSLLAWAAQPLVRSRLAGATAAGAAPAPSLEEALVVYEREMNEGIPAVPPARAEADALLASLQRFAGAWSGATPALAKGALPPKLEMLFRAATDLCTAGDLLRCEDLFTL